MLMLFLVLLISVNFDNIFQDLSKLDRIFLSFDRSWTEFANGRLHPYLSMCLLSSLAPILHIIERTPKLEIVMCY